MYCIYIIFIASFQVYKCGSFHLWSRVVPFLKSASFFLEKRKVEGYIVDLRSKKSKNGAGRTYSYFDLTIHTEKNKLMAIRLPDKHKYFKSNTSY